MPCWYHRRSTSGLPCINSLDLLAVAVICGDATLIRKLYRKIINSVVWQSNCAKILPCIRINLEEVEFKCSSSKFVMIYADAVKTIHLTTVIGNSDFTLEAKDFYTHSLDPNFEY